MESQEMQWLLREKYDGMESEAFYADCARLTAGEPLGYVIGWTPFLECRIWVDSRPLIPRPETEYWTEQAIAQIRTRQANQSSPVRVLDLCAGSGAIGVAVAQAIPTAYVTLTEIDRAHLPSIEKNLRENTPSHNSELYRILESDLFAALSPDAAAAGFDFILTNPPYIDRAANTVEASVTAHEPHLALFGGQSGMEIINQILAEASSYLAPRGELWMEHEPFQVTAISQAAKAHLLTCQTQKDQYHTDRYSILTKAVAK